ncbi:MAG: nucleoside phosphorylase [Anaerolineales bacterium]|nr:nucleoside phosphorylase [Anaerolineales bacterium]
MNVLPITGLPVGKVSAAVLVCGDPERAQQIVGFLNDAKTLSQQREYHAYSGDHKGQQVTVCSHGVGSPGAAIAFEELIAAGAKRIIRVGTCGGFRQDLQPGSIVIATAAVQNTGYGRETVPIGYPAVADMALTLALEATAVQHQLQTASGIVLTRDNFYAGVPTRNIPDYKVLAAANVLAVEMECAALFIVGALRQVQTAAVLAVDGNVLQTAESMQSYQPHRKQVKTAVSQAIQIALDTVILN